MRHAMVCLILLTLSCGPAFAQPQAAGTVAEEIAPRSRFTSVHSRFPARRSLAMTVFRLHRADRSASMIPTWTGSCAASAGIRRLLRRANRCARGGAREKRQRARESGARGFRGVRGRPERLHREGASRTRRLSRAQSKGSLRRPLRKAVPLPVLSGVRSENGGRQNPPSPLRLRRSLRATSRRAARPDCWPMPARRHPRPQRNTLAATPIPLPWPRIVSENFSKCSRTTRCTISTAPSAKSSARTHQRSDAACRLSLRHLHSRAAFRQAVFAAAVLIVSGEPGVGGGFPSPNSVITP